MWKSDGFKSKATDLGGLGRGGTQSCLEGEVDSNCAGQTADTVRHTLGNGDPHALCQNVLREVVGTQFVELSCLVKGMEIIVKPNPVLFATIDSVWYVVVVTSREVKWR